MSSFAEQQLAALNVQGLKSLIAGFDAACRQHSDRPAFTAMGATISFAELDAQSAYLARFLLEELGLTAGDRVAIQLPNINQYPVAAWAVLRAGLVIVNTNPLYTERELVHQFSDSGSKVMIGLQSMLGATARVIDKTPVEHVISVGVPPGDEEQALFSGLSVGLVDFTAALKGGAGMSCELNSGSMQDLAVLQYTGGTTGVPKGAMLTQGNLFAGMCQSLEKYPNKYPQGELLLAPMPLYHIYGFTAHCISGVLNGRLSVLIPNPRDVDSIIDAWKAHRVTSLCGINTLFAAMLAHPEFSKLDFSTLQAVIAGGTTLVEELAVAWE
ncbi:MAG: AMP-binding protein, partial [Pseudomonadota bacterium]